MNKNCLLISTGPTQLLYGISVLLSKSRLLQVKGVISIYDTSKEEEVLKPLDQLICDNFNLAYCGSISELPTKSVEFLKKNFIRFIFNKTLFYKELSKNIMKHLDGIFNDYNVYLPDRPNRISDNFLLHMIRGQETHYFPDGFYLRVNRNLMVRSMFRLLGVIRYYHLCPGYYYTLPFLPERIRTRTKVIKTETKWFHHVCMSLDNLFNDFNLKKEATPKCTVLIWQDLYPKFIKNKKRLYNFYKKIIAKEIKQVEKLIIKPHPRSTQKQYYDIKRLAPDEYQDRLEILTDKKIKHVPIELLRHVLSYEKVVGISSTALMSLNSFGDCQVGIYCDKLFPDKFKREVERIAKFVNVEVLYL